MTRTDDDIEIDFKDLFFYILSKWKLIIILMVIGAVGAGAFSYYRSAKAANGASDSTNEYSKENLKEAKAALSDDEAANVEAIYRQYKAYQTNQQTMADNITNSIFFTYEDEDPVLKVSKYCIVSDVQNIDSYFADMAMGTDQIERIRTIVGASDKINNIKDLVYITGDDNTSSDFGQADTSQTEITSGRYKTFLTVSVLGTDKSQCDSISDVVDEALQNERTTLQNVDPNVSITYVDAQYSSDAAKEYINSEQQTLLSNNSSIITSITSLQTNQINQFSDEEKAYYDMLTARDSVSSDNNKEEETAQPAVHGSVSKKYVAAGLAGGLILAIILAIILYNADHSVKTADELTSLYGIPLLDTIKKSSKKGSREVQEELLGSDISITAEKNGLKSCYFIAEDADMDIVDEIKSKIDGITTGSGQPLSDTKALSEMAAMDAVVIVTHLKKTQLSSIDRIGDLVNRFDMKVVGTVVVE